jgi:hypothetical protein
LVVILAIMFFHHFFNIANIVSGGH